MKETVNRALVTGASSGIGREYCRQLADRCDEIILTARRDEQLQCVADEIRSRDTACSVVLADLASTIGIARLVETIRQRGPFLYLVNNAGFGTLGPFTEQAPATQEAMVTLHINATMQLTLAALDGMQRQGVGYVINVSSMAALAPFGSIAVYCGTKAFLSNFSVALQQEVKSRGIRVQCLCPGYTRTEFHSGAAFNEFDESLIPDEAWMESAAVVAESLDALVAADERVIVVPGDSNRRMARQIVSRQLESL